MTNSLVFFFFFFQWRDFLNINAAMQSSGGIIDNLQFTSHDWYASLRIDNREMIEGNKEMEKPHQAFHLYVSRI